MKLTAASLETEKIGKLLPKFLFPAILSNLITSVYNIVDQIFIGHSVGILGNAATNVAFPVVLVCTAVSLMAGVGCAAGFNLECGRGNRESAGKIVGNCIVFMLVTGMVISAVLLTSLTPLVRAFGATESVLPYAKTYLFITAWSIPQAIIGAGGSIIIRSDGSPVYSMISILTGAIINTILDAVFIFGFDMGIAGAAYATVIGQTVTAVMTLAYLRNFKTIRLVMSFFKPHIRIIGKIITLGIAPFANNISMFLVQILLNNAINRYGALSQYGSDIPLACVGVVTKLNTIVVAIVAGIAQGAQPIISFNYGAKNYKRVKETAKYAIFIMLAVSSVVFLCYQLFPRQLVSIFGTGTELYYIFSERFMRIFMMLICINGMQVTAGNIFTSIGKARYSVFISLVRQVLFLPPLILLLPLHFGIDGIMAAGPISDAMCVLTAILLLSRENRNMGNDFKSDIKNYGYTKR
jgi:putative MATE family efflux protein